LASLQLLGPLVRVVVVLETDGELVPGHRERHQHRKRHSDNKKNSIQRQDERRRVLIKHGEPVLAQVDIDRTEENQDTRRGVSIYVQRSRHGCAPRWVCRWDALAVRSPRRVHRDVVGGQLVRQVPVSPYRRTA
jgi:hypothetical protein